MNEINVIWLTYTDAPRHGYWCYGWLEEILSNTGGHREAIYWGEHIADIPEGEGAIVVLPAEYHAYPEHVERLNRELATLPWVVLILASDERGLFPVEDLAPHPKMSLWVMTPHFEKHTFPEGTQYLGEYYPQDARAAIVPALPRQRKWRAGFSGQITHQRREELVEALEGHHGVYINKTPGFTQGLGRFDYYDLLRESITAPAPAGPCTLDSFRAFEALEAGAVPILDLRCPIKCDGPLYWNSILGEHPLPTIQHWSDALYHIRSIAKDYPVTNNRVFAWWQMHKREKRQAILNGIPGYQPDDVTILIPTSVIPSHPDTLIIQKTILSARDHFPKADIIVMIDGVREEQEHRRTDYNAYVERLLRICNADGKIFPIIFDDHQHQANMTRRALDYVRTPLVLFMEHDTPLVTDLPFDWENIIDLMKSGDMDMLRFHYENRIHPEHEWLYKDLTPITMYGVPLLRTLQWSQRPHIASTEYYRKILAEHFPPTGRTMIEDKMHSVVQCDPQDHRVAVYYPDGPIIRSANLDGRKDDPKYEMQYE